MNEVEAVIRELNKEGKSPRAIATELYDRGLKTNLGKCVTPDMVRGFLHQLGHQPPAVLLPDPVKTLEAEAYASAEDAAPGRKEPYFGKNGPAAFVPEYRPVISERWRNEMDGGQHTKEGDFIQTRPRVDYGGENSYPDAPPYNYTHMGA